jgi:hypothetical protein
VRNHLLAQALLALGALGLIGAGIVGAQSGTDRPNRVVTPLLARGEPAPTRTPTVRPTPYVGPVASLYLESARVLGQDPLETRDTHFEGGREILDDPSRPQFIVHYPRFGTPGWPAGNTIFAAHVNYIGYGNGPFAFLTDATPGDALYVTMANGTRYTYTVKSVEIVKLANLDMDLVVYPPLDSYTERITLISCGGTFIPAAVGGEYDSRVILVAERYVE